MRRAMSGSAKRPPERLSKRHALDAARTVIREDARAGFAYGQEIWNAHGFSHRAGRSRICRPTFQ